MKHQIMIQIYIQFIARKKLPKKLLWVYIAQRTFFFDSLLGFTHIFTSKINYNPIFIQKKRALCILRRHTCQTSISFLFAWVQNVRNKTLYDVSKLNGENSLILIISINCTVYQRRLFWFMALTQGFSVLLRKENFIDL